MQAWQFQMHTIPKTSTSMMRVWKKSAGGEKKTLNTNFVLVAKIHASSQVDAPKAYRARCGQRKQHDEALGKSAGGGKWLIMNFVSLPKYTLPLKVDATKHMHQSLIMLDVVNITSMLRLWEKWLHPTEFFWLPKHTLPLLAVPNISGPTFSRLTAIFRLLRLEQC